MKLPSEPIKIHFFYVIIILFMAIIWLFTWRFAGDDNVVSHVSLAASVASLILALLAIVYAFVTNSSLTQSLSDLTRVSGEFFENTSKLTEVRSDLKEYLNTVRDIQSKVSDQGETIKSIDKRLTQDFAGNPESIELSETVISQYIERLTLPGQYVFYILRWADELKEDGLFAFEDIPRLNHFKPMEATVTAYLDSFSALGLVEVGLKGRIDPDGGYLPTLYTITFVHPVAKAKIDEVMVGLSWQYSTPSNAARFFADVETIREYFNRASG